MSFSVRQFMANLFFSIKSNGYFEKWKKLEFSQRLCGNKPANMMF